MFHYIPCLFKIYCLVDERFLDEFWPYDWLILVEFVKKDVGAYHIFVLQETLRWNGTTNKKKGQKWGREKNLSMTQEDDVCNETTGEKLIIEEGKVENDQINFEILCPLTRLPQVCLSLQSP